MNSSVVAESGDGFTKTEVGCVRTEIDSSEAVRSAAGNVLALLAAGGRLSKPRS